MGIKKSVEMAKSFGKAIASRGITNKKTEPYTKKLRVLSCLGNEHLGGELPPCEHLKKSKTPGKFYCGGCGCGDRKSTWLLADGEEYSKLDYPNLSCPLKMPGFSDYEVSSPEESIEPITRRYYVETLRTDEVEKIPVTDPDIPENIKEAMKKREEKLKKSE